MTDIEPPRELRFTRSSSILNYIHQFSSTEKVIFGALVILAGITTIIMASQVNSYFMTEVPTYGGTLTEGVIGLPRTVNPVLAITDADRDISALVYSGLMKYHDGSLVPDIAKSYSVSDDGLTYSFILRSGITFSDGTQLSADDVAFTIQKIQDPVLKSPRRADWANVTVHVTSPTQIEFALKQPYSPFLTTLTFGIMPKHIWSSVSDDQFIFSSYNIQPIGSGPYKISSVDRDSGGIPTLYRLTTWKNYYGPSEHIGTIALRFFADNDKALAALDSGSIDSLASISPDDAARLATNSAEPYTIASAPLPRIFGVFFNQNQNHVLADKVVRQALDMSVDRIALVKTVLNGYGQAVDGPLPISMATSSTSTTAPYIAGAQALLEKSGWKKDPTTGIYTKAGAKNSIQTLSFDIYTADTPDLKQAADMIKASWTALGAQVDIKVFDSSDLYQNVIRPRKYDALLFGELIGKDRDVYAFWHSSERTAPGLNVALYANSKVDKLLENIRSTTNDTDRTNMYADLNNLIQTDVPAVFLYSPEFLYAIPKSLHGITLSDITTPADRWNSIDSWYITTQKVWKVFAKNSN